MNLSRQQRATLRRLTTVIQRRCMPDEVMHFRLAPLTSANDKAVMFVASNTGSPWYASHKLAVLIIGPRGGIDRKNITLDNISKLVLDL